MVNNIDERNGRVQGIYFNVCKQHMCNQSFHIHITCTCVCACNRLSEGWFETCRCSVSYEQFKLSKKKHHMHVIHCTNLCVHEVHMYEKRFFGTVSLAKAQDGMHLWRIIIIMLPWIPTFDCCQ